MVYGKNQGMPSERRVYEVAGAKDDLLPSSKKKPRLDLEEEDKEGGEGT